MAGDMTMSVTSPWTIGVLEHILFGVLEHILFGRERAGGEGGRGRAVTGPTSLQAGIFLPLPQPMSPTNDPFGKLVINSATFGLLVHATISSMSVCQD